MKKRKFKLLASITSLVLVVAVMAIGVWAATQQAVNVTTNVTFTASGVSGSISGTLTGLTDNDPLTDDDTHYYNLDNTSEGAALTFSPSVPLTPNTWTIAATAIGDNGEGLANSLVYTFTISNSSTTTAMALTISNVTVDTNAITAGGDSVSNILFTSTSEAANALTKTIAKSTTETYTLTFDVADDAQSITGAVIAFTLNLAIAT